MYLHPRMHVLTVLIDFLGIHSTELYMCVYMCLYWYLSILSIIHVRLLYIHCRRKIAHLSINNLPAAPRWPLFGKYQIVISTLEGFGGI